MAAVYQAVARVTPMFIVKWVVLGKEAEPVETENIGALGLETVITACRYRLAAMRLNYADTPPDGFIVLDDSKRERYRSIGTPRHLV
jgi:hypothetical protein